jgi:hypothetical protein
MKPLIPILIVATTSLAVASVQYAQQASAQRKRADAEVVLRQKQEVRIAELERTQQRLERELSIAQGTVDALPAPIKSAAAPPARETPKAGTASANGFVVARVGEAVPPAAVPMFNRGPEMSPGALNFMRSRMKGSIRRTYEDVGTVLGLPADKANKLIDLLADQQTRTMGRPPVFDPQNPQSLQQHFQEQQQKNQAEIASLIGQDKVDEWKKYQESLPDRAQLNQVREQLDNAGVPMSESQRTELLTAMAEERSRSPRPSYDSGLPSEEAMAQMSQWQNEFDKALLDRAKQVLTSEQYKSYKEYYDWQSEMRSSFRSVPAEGRGFVRLHSFSSSGGGTSTVVGSGNAVVSASEAGAVEFVATPWSTSPPPPPQPAQPAQERK